MDFDKIFSYPIDCELLMRKQKSIKRELLAQKKAQYLPKRIAILNGSTTEEIKNILELFLLYAGIRPEFYESEYNKYYEDAVFENEQLDAFRPEIVVVFTSMVNLLYIPALEDTEEEVSKKLEKEYRRYEKIWTELESKYKCIIIQNNVELSHVSPIGNLTMVLPQGIRNFIEKLNIKFSDFSVEHPNFYLHDLHGLAAHIGLSHWHNRMQYYAYKTAMSLDVAPEVANSLAKIIRSILGKSKKCLVLDLDNTLWGGVVGDDGVEGLQIGHETPLAEAYTEFQSYVKSLKDRGVLLAVCSKNDASVAKSGFDHPDSVLKVDDFVAFYANWMPKNQNILSIAREINIGVDSLVFIDDNPAERQLVRETLPEVAVLEVDPKNVFSYIRAIEESGFFEPISISQDDRKRSQLYMENKQRDILRKELSSYEDFLRSLEMKAEIAPFCPMYYERISQLTNRSNQFNLTTKRFSVAEIQEMAEDDRYITIYGRLRDKFGDNGLVSVVVGEKRNEELHIILWLMSCRVLKRGMEDAMLDALAVEAERRGIKKVIGYYYHTKKNGMVENMYERFGFHKTFASMKNTVWEINVKEFKRFNKFIEVKKELMF